MAQETQHILVVGVGRLGTRAAQALCAAGMTRITLCDYDIVLAENLEQQPLFHEEDIGKPKAQAAAARLHDRYPGARIDAALGMFSPEKLDGDITLIIDGTDNLETRLVLNDAARAKGVPLVIATATENRGMVFAVRPIAGTPCWQCISKGKVAGDDCAGGIDPVIADKVVREQAALALDILRGMATAQELLLIDDARVTRIGVRVNPACAACAMRYEHLGMPFELRYCASRGHVVARPNTPRVLDLDGIRPVVTVMKEYGSALLVQLGSGTALVHRHGQIEFSDVSEHDAREFAARILRAR